MAEVQQNSPSTMVGDASSTEGPQNPKHYARDQITEATMVAQVGIAPRNFGMMSIIGLGYTVLNSWTAMATSLSVALPSGGPTAVIWGIIPSFIGNLAMSASLAEICHVYCTSGGPYHWSFILAPAHSAPFISYLTGWFACAGWWALMATTGSLAGALIMGAYSLTHAGFEEQRWQIYVVYIGYTCIATALNIWGIKILPFLNKSAISWSLLGAAVIAITCLACSSGDYSSPEFVFTEYINETGWNNGVAWILGLLQSSFGLTGYDAVSHMVEEMPNPSVNAPKAMVLAVIIGSSSSFVFLICLLFCIKDVDAVISGSSGALLGAMYQATGSVAGSVCLQIFPIVSMMFAAQGILCGASRMTYAFARDGGLPFSAFFARMDPRTGVPVNSVLLTSTLVIIFGVLYIPSASALNAILSASVVLLNVSYSIPVALLLIRGRHLLRPPSFPEPTLTMGPILGPIANVVGLVFTVFTTAFFIFPPEFPATAENMNYAIAVFGVIFVVAGLTWIFQGRKHFTGPRDLGGLLELARAEIDAPVARDLEHTAAEKKRKVEA